MKKRKEEKILSRQVNKNITKQVRIDAGWHREFKVLAAKAGKTIRELVEEGFPETLDTYKGYGDT